jgi:hypothetical protein
MRKIGFQIILSVLCLSAQAQKVSNIRVEQRGQEIVVFYSLETSSPCEVSLLFSQDSGSTWSAPLKNVSGDVGKNISSGEKQIIWELLSEREQLVGDAVKFKVLCKNAKFASDRTEKKDNWFRVSFITLGYFAYYQLWRLVKP